MNVANRPFELSNTYYDLLYKDKDYKQETAYVHNILQTYSPHAKKILELGSGTGNYSAQFSQAGYTITGIELSKEMNALAHLKSIPNFTAISADITTFQLSGSYDATLALFHVISYLTTNTQLTDCFTQVARHLKPQGIFIFDVWYSPAVYLQLPQTRVKHVENDLLSVVRKANPLFCYNDNVVTVNYDVTIIDKQNDTKHVFTETHNMRHFSTPEVKLLATATGFKLLAAEEFLTARQPGKDTWGVCYILQKYA